MKEPAKEDVAVFPPGKIEAAMRVTALPMPPPIPYAPRDYASLGLGAITI